MSTEPRIIKKYQNRCLYDTRESCYISMNELKQLIYDGEEFVVQEAKSKKDITRNILLQIIAEEENDKQPMFSPEMLMKFIRMHGAEMQNVYGDYLEKSMSIFEDKSREFFTQMGKSMTQNPMSMWTNMTQQNIKNWQKFQKELFSLGEDPDSK